MLCGRTIGQCWRAIEHGLVAFGDCAFGELLLKQPQHPLIACHYHQSAGVHVEAVGGTHEYRGVIIRGQMLCAVTVRHALPQHLLHAHRGRGAV